MDTVCGSWQQGISYAELCLWGWGRLGAPPALCCLSQVTPNSPGERAALKAGAATWCWHCSVSAGHAAGSLLHREMSPASLVTPPSFAVRAVMEFLPQSPVGSEKTAVFQLKSQGHLGMCTAVEPVGIAQGLAGVEGSSTCFLLLSTTFQGCPDCIHAVQTKHISHS